MKNLSSLINLILLTALCFVMYFVISSDRNLKDAKIKIIDVYKEITILHDSINKTQKRITLIIDKLKFAENELKILKNDRELLELEEKRRMAANWEELQELKRQIQEKENKKNILKKNANNFEL